MKFYAALHKTNPNSQLDGEVSYQGYQRMEIDYDGDLINLDANIFFPSILNQSGQIATYFSIGSVSQGQGEIFAKIPLLPHIALDDIPERRTLDFWIEMGASPEQAQESINNYGYKSPHVCLVGCGINISDSVNPIAKLIHGLIFRGLHSANDFHPKLLEAVNDELTAAGVPVIAITRAANAAMKGDMKTLNLNQIA